MDNFFGRSGTMNQAMNLASSIGSMKSSSAKDRLSGLVGLVMSLFA